MSATNNKTKEQSKQRENTNVSNKPSSENTFFTIQSFFYRKL